LGSFIFVIGVRALLITPLQKIKNCIETQSVKGEAFWLSLWESCQVKTFKSNPPLNLPLFKGETFLKLPHFFALITP